MLRNYLIMSFKVLGRRRFFTFISLFGISVTLAVLMLVAALYDHAAAPQGTESDLDRMLLLIRMTMSGPKSQWNGPPGYGFLDKYTRDLPGVERMTIFDHPSEEASFIGTERVVSALRHCDAAYWNVFRFEFLEGSPFTEADDRDGRRVAVINAATKRRFFGDAPALGKALDVSGESYRVVGVVQDVPILRRLTCGEIYVPFGAIQEPGYRTRLMGSCQAAYLTEGSRVHDELRAAFAERLTRVEFSDPEHFDTMRGRPMTALEVVAQGFMGREAEDAPVRRMLLVASALALLFMLLPAVNLMTITLSRIVERSEEIGVRKAFGASSWHLVGQLLVENSVLCLIGGALSLVLAAGALKVIELSGKLPYAAFSLNWRLFAAALALALVFALVSGVGPAWRMSRLRPVEALRGGSR